MELDPPTNGVPPRAFSIVELLVSVVVLGILMFLVGHLFNGATLATDSANKHMDSDTEARALFERMAIDFAQMLKRADIDYYLKDSNNPQTGSGAGMNDQIAFFSRVPGNLASTVASNAKSPVSLVSYRIEPAPIKLQRLGLGLLWDGKPPEGLVFTSNSLSSGTTTISTHWPAATNTMADPNYEIVGPDVFRMEYYYVLKSPVTSAGTPRMDQNTPLASQLSAVPWDTRIPGHTSVEGLRDVAAIIIAIAVIDPKSRVVADEAQLEDLAQTLEDFSGNMNPGDLEESWRASVDSQHTSRLPASAIRFYSRCFFLQ